MRPANTQISLDIRPIWSESSLYACTCTNLEFLATHWAHSEDSDQTRRMPRLIWVFAGRTCHFVGFVTRGLIWFSTGLINQMVSALLDCSCWYLRYCHFLAYSENLWQKSIDFCGSDKINIKDTKLYLFFLCTNWLDCLRRVCNHGYTKRTHMSITVHRCDSPEKLKHHLSVWQMHDDLFIGIKIFRADLSVLHFWNNYKL